MKSGQGWPTARSLSWRCLRQEFPHCEKCCDSSTLDNRSCPATFPHHTRFIDSTSQWVELLGTRERAAALSSV